MKAFEFKPKLFTTLKNYYFILIQLLIKLLYKKIVHFLV